MILIIAEKPKAAKKIAEALGNVRTVKGGTSYYYQVEDGSIIVASAVGHLYGLVPGREGWDYPIFEAVWKPKYENKGFEYTKSYIKNLHDLGKQADEIIIATDYDIEGGVIGHHVVEIAIGGKLPETKRMKFSTLTPGELLRAFKDAHLHNSFEKGMVNAGLLRHYMDWFWGINLSRALTTSYKTTGSFRVLSTGRVQGPTLKILVDREREIKKFDSKFFYKLIAKIKDYVAEGPELDDVKKALSLFLSLKSPARVVDVSKNVKTIEPPSPFNLTDLQTEASRVLKYTPKKTLEIAQKLYEDGFISYPRTSSQKLPKELDLKGILTKLSRKYSFASRLIGRKYHEGKKTDPAHPAIYPPGELPRDRDPQEMKLYDLIARRFMASFSDPAKRESTKISLDISGTKFLLTGRRTLVKGFTAIYPAGLEEKKVPSVKKGDSLIVSLFELRRKQKRPPKRYTAAGLLKLMEKLNLGTKATRANIIQTLYDRGYIEGKSIRVLELGESVINALEKAAPDVVSVELTRAFEEKMGEVHEGRRDMESVLEDSKKELAKILSEFKNAERSVGQLLKTTAPQRPKQKPPGGKLMGECSCGEKIYALKSRNDKRYARCSGCDKSWGLPQRGTMKILKDTCRKCKILLIEIKRKDAQFKLCVEHGFS